MVWEVKIALSCVVVFIAALFTTLFAPHSEPTAARIGWVALMIACLSGIVAIWRHG